MRGRFLVLEGVEGVGKSTQATLLAEWLGSQGVPHLTAREPGGTPVGEAIRSVVQDRPELEVPPETELLLYVAARSAFVRQVVRPALERGEMVVADRYAMSTLAYQGYGRGLELKEVRRVNDFATGGLEPDLYVYIDLPVEAGTRRRSRAGSGDDRIEAGGRAFLERVRQGYLTLVEEDSAAVMVDGSGSPEEVHGRIREALMVRFPETFPVGEV